MEGSITTPSLTLDIDPSNDEEESYEIKLIGEHSKEAHESNNSEKSLAEESDALPEWSVSEISCAIGLNAADRFQTDYEGSSASASAWGSPEKVVPQKSYSTQNRLEVGSSISGTQETTIKGNNEETAVNIKQLANSIHSLRNSIDAIQQKTLTPVNSPRRPKQPKAKQNTSESHSDEYLTNDEIISDKDTTPRAPIYSHYGKVLNSTPPVKDPGLTLEKDVGLFERNANASVSKSIPQSIVDIHKEGTKNIDPETTDRLSQMQSVLKQLENARKKYDQSRLPKRNLNLEKDFRSNQSEDIKNTNLLDESTSRYHGYSIQNKFENQEIRLKHADDFHEKEQVSNTAHNSSSQKHLNPDTKSLLAREFEEMNTFLDQVKNSTPSFTSTLFSPLESARLSSLEKASSNPTSSKSTMIMKDLLNVDSEAASSIKEALEKEKSQRLQLEEKISDQQKKLHDQEEQIHSLKVTNDEKLNLLLSVKLRWTEVSQQWIEQQKELSEKLKESNSQLSKLKTESNGVKQQFNVCQEELQRALTIATDFKLKLEEEEKTKNDVLNELLSQKTLKTKQLQLEQTKIEDLRNENQELKLQNEVLQNENQHLVRSRTDVATKASNELSKALEDLEKLNLDNQALNAKTDNIVEEKEAIESSLHTFYASQMESILTEKISTLQSNVRAWETNMLREKREAIEFLQNQHVIQIESLTERHLKDMENNRKDMRVVKASLAATRKEADALREQLGLERTQYEEKRNRISSTQPIFTSSTLTLATATNSNPTSLRERIELIETEPFRSLPITYNSPESPKGRNTDIQDDHITTRRKNVWSEILTSTDHAEKAGPVLSRVQNNLLNSPRELTSKRSAHRNGYPTNDDGTSSTSEDTLQRDFSKRSLPIDRTRDTSKYKTKSIYNKSRTSDIPGLVVSQRRLVPKQTNSLMRHSDINTAVSSTRSNPKAQGSNNSYISPARGIFNSTSQTLQENCNTGEDDTMTPEEKKSIVSNFVQDFFKENPESVLDPHLLYDLNNRVLRLVDSSPNAIENQSVVRPDISNVTNTSNLELKQMLGERLLNTLSFQDIESQGATSHSRYSFDTNIGGTNAHTTNLENGQHEKPMSSSTSS